MPNPGEQEVLEQNANAPAEETAKETTTTEAPEPQAEEPKVEPEQPPEKSERPVWTMPVAKAQEEKKRAVEKAKQEAVAEAEAKMQQLRDEYEQKLQEAARLPKGEQADELERVAQEYGLDPEATKALANAVAKTIKLPDTSKYDQILKEREIEAHKAQVRADIEAKVLPLILKDSPSATPEHLAQVRSKIEELAFSEGYNTYRLEDIYKVHRDDFTFANQMSAEKSGGRGTDIVSFKKLSDEEEVELANRSMSDYKRYLDWERSQSSRFEAVE